MILKPLYNSFSHIFFGWRMVGLVSATRVVGGQYGFTVFFLPVSQDLGLSRAAASLTFSLSRAQAAIEAPLVGYLAAYSTVTVHFVPLMVWKDLPQEESAFLLGAFAFINMLAHFIIGWIADKVNKPGLMTLCHLVCALAVLPLIGGAVAWQLWLFITVFTFLDASFPVVWATIGDFSGRRYFATIRGMMSFFYMWGSFAGPFFTGAVYDRTESYAPVLWLLFTILSLATLLNILLMKPWKQRMVALGGGPIPTIH